MRLRLPEKSPQVLPKSTIRTFMHSIASSGFQKTLLSSKSKYAFKNILAKFVYFRPGNHVVFNPETPLSIAQGPNETSVVLL